MEEVAVTPLEKQLYKAAVKGDGDAVAWLIAADADVNGTVFGDNALMRASKGGHVEVVKQLVAAGADVNWEDEHGSTPLTKTIAHWHEYFRNAEIVKVLLAAGADVNHTDKRGATVLMWAADRPAYVSDLGSESLEIIEMLLLSNVSVNHTDDAGETALHWASNSNLPKVVRSDVVFFRRQVRACLCL